MAFYFPFIQLHERFSLQICDGYGVNEGGRKRSWPGGRNLIDRSSLTSNEKLETSRWTILKNWRTHLTFRFHRCFDWTVLTPLLSPSSLPYNPSLLE
jgi:hypothetical protein